MLCLCAPGMHALTAQHAPCLKPTRVQRPRSPAPLLRSAGAQPHIQGCSARAPLLCPSRYVHVLTDSVQRRQSETERRLAELDRWRRQGRGGIGAGGRRRSSAASLDDGCSSGGGGGVLQVPGWLRRPALLAPCMVLVASLPPDHAAARVLRALPLLALMPHASA